MKTLGPSLLFLSLVTSFSWVGAAAPLTVSGLTFESGDSWTAQTPRSSMRAGEYAIQPEGAAEPVVAVFFYFGAGQGGSVQANVARWFGQFAGTPKTSSEQLEFGGKTVTMVSAVGTYEENIGGPFSGRKVSRPDYRLIGAIVPGDDAYVFIKLTGPAKDVAAIEEQFTALATSPFRS